jgi:hypothetical protein
MDIVTKDMKRVIGMKGYGKGGRGIEKGRKIRESEREEIAKYTYVLDAYRI